MKTNAHGNTDWDFDDLLDSDELTSELPSEQTSYEDDLEDLIGEYIPEEDLSVYIEDSIEEDIEKLNEQSIVDTRKLRVDLDRVNIGKVYEVNLHRIVISSFDKDLFGGVKSYSNSDLGVEDELTEEAPEIGAESIVLNSSGETLGERLRNKQYAKARLKLSDRLAEMGIESNIYERYKDRKSIKLDVIEKKAKEERRVLAGDNDSFIKKHRRKTVYEKSILKHLGVSLADLEKLISPKSILSREEKAKLLSIASGIGEMKDKRDNNKAYISDGDMAVLFFLDICRYATLRNLYYADGMKGLGSVYYRLKKLEKMGLVRCVIVYGTPGVYSITNLGKKMIGSDKPDLSKKQANPGSLAERIYVNHVQACLYSGCLDILQSGVESNRLDIYGNKILGEEVIPEAELVRSMSKKAVELKGGIFVKNSYPGESNTLLREAWEITWRQWENNGRRLEEAPELVESWLYILFYEEGIKSSYVIPDIVVKRDRLADGSPQSIAIEVERAIKTVDEYATKLSAYKQDNRVYSKVVYVTPNKLTAERVQEAAERIGFDRYDIVPMIDESGLVGPEKSHWVL